MRAPSANTAWPTPALAAAAALPVLAFATALWVLAVAAAPLVQGLELGLYVIANLIVFGDMFDFGLRLHFIRRHTRGTNGTPAPTSWPLAVGTFNPYQMKLHLKPYALVVSVHDAEDEIDDFLEAARPWRDRLFVIDDASSDNTLFHLQRAGVRCVRTPVNLKKPGAIRELLRQLPPEIETVVVLDPDARILDSGRRGISDLEAAVFEFQRSGYAALCPRIVVRTDGWLARLQGLEYGLACMLGRHSLADHSITSGVAVYRRDALEAVLREHSLSVYAEDLRNALILLARGERVYYDPRLVVQVDGQRSWRGLMSQRVGWAYGLLRVCLEHARSLVAACRGRGFLCYHYGLYVGVLTLLLHPLRVASVLLLSLSLVNGIDLVLGLDWVPDVASAAPVYFLAAYLKYLVLALVGVVVVAADVREWLRLLPAVPVYLLYAMGLTLPVTLGYLNWFSLRILGRRVYRDHYEDEEARLRAGRAGA